MYTYIVDELTAIASTLIPNFSGEESIMGHSMGGHGAFSNWHEKCCEIQSDFCLFSYCKP
jgi:S-formylglutathione hydrolase FrmB